MTPVQTSWRSVLAGLVLVTVLGAIGVAQRQQPPRLIVTNYTGAVITVSSLVDGTWERRGRLRPGASVPVGRVANGDRFRADWPGKSREKVVRLRYDQAYGGLQDTWLVK